MNVTRCAKCRKTRIKVVRLPKNTMPPKEAFNYFNRQTISVRLNGRCECISKKNKKN